MAIVALSDYRAAPKEALLRSPNDVSLYARVSVRALCVRAYGCLIDRTHRIIISTGLRAAQSSLALRFEHNENSREQLIAI